MSIRNFLNEQKATKKKTTEEESWQKRVTKDNPYGDTEEELKAQRRYNKAAARASRRKDITKVHGFRAHTEYEGPSLIEQLEVIQKAFNNGILDEGIKKKIAGALAGLALAGGVAGGLGGGEDTESDSSRQQSRSAYSQSVSARVKNKIKDMRAKRDYMKRHGLGNTTRSGRTKTFRGEMSPKQAQKYIRTQGR